MQSTLDISLHACLTFRYIWQYRRPMCLCRCRWGGHALGSSLVMSEVEREVYHGKIWSPSYLYYKKFHKNKLIIFKNIHKNSNMDKAENPNLGAIRTNRRTSKRQSKRMEETGREVVLTLYRNTENRARRCDRSHKWSTGAANKFWGWELAL